MRKLAVGILAFAIVLTPVVWRVGAQPGRPLASLMPGGALLYLESGDFSKLLREWNTSKVKKDWLGSANHAVFSKSNLYFKLGSLLEEYSAAAGFTPGLETALEIAGTESALALYDPRGAEFLYITRTEESRLAEAALWRMRNKFEIRQSAGIDFYIHAAANRTVAFAFTQGYLVVATRDDLIAQSLALFAGGHEPSIADARWYQGATKAAARHGELRMVLNLETLASSTHFRSYWIYRNGSVVRQYSAGIADVTREPGRIVEDRVFLRANEAGVGAAPESGRRALAELLRLAPGTAGLYKAWASPEAGFTTDLIAGKLLAPRARRSRFQRYAPQASSGEESAGSERDLETRIDEPPLPAGSEGGLATGPLRAWMEAARPEAMIQIQSSEAATGGFVTTPCVLAIVGAAEWDANAAREALTASIETLWTTSRLGGQWTPATAGSHAVERLDGLAPLWMVVRGRVLFIGNDAALLASVLDARTVRGEASGITYAAGLGHGRERENYVRLMEALDFAQVSEESRYRVQGSNEPSFFSGNIASLSSVLSFVNGVTVTASDRGQTVVERVVYEVK